ncbi:response regulator [Massilia niastensis]|uniref:response regulator n=1 Tax=Massilia niastensis TaxID=544911 RepID=UPI001E37EA7E|nr:response regulator [Massilia niastensis]
MGADKDAVETSGAALRKVLVVDDEPDLADLAAALLCGNGVEAMVAYSGPDALRALEGDREIDAVFSDVMMPGMTGLQLAECIRERYPWVKVILTSGYTIPSLLAGARQPYLFTSKPYSIETIIRLLHS